MFGFGFGFGLWFALDFFLLPFRLSLLSSQNPKYGCDSHLENDYHPPRMRIPMYQFHSRLLDKPCHAVGTLVETSYPDLGTDHGWGSRRLACLVVFLSCLRTEDSTGAMTESSNRTNLRFPR